MRNTTAALAVCAALGLPGAAFAQTVFFDDFNSETPALNTTPSQWTVTRGTVDIIGTGPSGSLFAQPVGPGHGYYIDLDGSTFSAGEMTGGGLSLAGGTPYNLSFLLAGSQRGDINTVTYGIDLDADATLDFFSSATLASSAPFTAFSLLFTPLAATSSARIVFNHTGGDNIGLLLDDVSLSAVPEAEPYAMLVAGLGMLGFLVRRRRPVRR